MMNADELRAHIVELAICFEDANRRGDAIDTLDDDTELTPDLLAAAQAADDEYNRSKAALFAAVQALARAMQ